VARPETVECEVCGETVGVGPRGRVPRFCADHSAADLDQRTDTEREADEQAEQARREIAEAKLVDDGWPRQIAPVVWLDQTGRRYTDLSDAQRGAQEIRDR
jgi:hypothetical protein